MTTSEQYYGVTPLCTWRSDREVCGISISGFGSIIDINRRSASFFKGVQSDYMGVDDPKREAMVHQWRGSLDPAAQNRISADMQQLIADQLYWVNVTGQPFFQAYRDNVQGYTLL